MKARIEPTEDGKFKINAQVSGEAAELLQAWTQEKDVEVDITLEVEKGDAKEIDMLMGAAGVEITREQPEIKPEPVLERFRKEAQSKQHEEAVDFYGE